jgi:muramoyltetrapeptide carboxypeptidase LdcA involved in peptidoglycan recycling
MVRDPQIDAVGCLTGGFAASELLRFLKRETFIYLRQHPKIFFGYSDFSLILNALFSNGIVSLHAPNVCSLYRRSLNTQKSLYLSLIGELPAEIGPLSGWKPIIQGFARGRLLVSNLECLVSLLGTPLDPLRMSKENLILALEEVGEDKSTISRWLSTLAIHTETQNIGGIIIGRFIKIGEEEYPVWGKEMGIKDLFLKFFGKRKIPIASLPEFGHVEEKMSFLSLPRRERVDFLTLPSGVRVLFKVKTSSCRLRFLEKAIY